jgi:hypothetical protein
MARTSPSGTSTRTFPTPEASGGGGGATNQWKEWIDLPLDPTDANGWIVRDGVGVNADTSLGMDGDVLVFNQASATKLQIHGSTMKGKVMIRKKHIEPWNDAGVATPAGYADHIFQPEMMILKIEVQFDTDGGGPINGVASNYGQKMSCMVGLIGYNSDQGEAPTAGGTSVLWIAAQVWKYLGGEPSGYSQTNLYKSGFKSYFSTGTGLGYSWKNQASAPAQAHDTIVFCTPPMRKESDTGRNDVWGGSYSADTPFYPLSILGQSCYDSATKFSNTGAQNFWHVAVWFGADDNSNVQGNIRVKKIRMLWQPVQNRASLT